MRGSTCSQQVFGDQLSVALGCNESIQGQAVVYFVGPEVNGGVD